MKYDFNLVLDDTTSTGKIIKSISDGSNVLEFGPGNGRVTDYLTNEKKCKVSIVEFDPELYNCVMKYAVDGFCGDIEEYKWCDLFKQNYYDVIIFADVLEHLRNPEAVLKRAKSFLKDEGKILITFPNIAHNSVLIDLFNNKFNYQEYGLLDKTHNTFFTQNGFESLFDSCGLFIENEEYTYSQVGENEIVDSYDDLPMTVRYQFKIRPFGEVYQYFFCLVKSPTNHLINNFPLNSTAVIRVNFFLVFDNEIRVESYLLNTITKENKSVHLMIPDNIKEIKVKPMEISGIVCVKIKSNGENLQIKDSNAIWENKDGIYAFINNKPYLSIDGKKIRGKTIVLEFDYQYLGAFDPITKKSLIDYYKINNKYHLTSKQLKLQQYKTENIKKRYSKLLDSFPVKCVNNLFVLSKMLQGKNVLSKKIENRLTYNIDSCEYDDFSKKLTIMGWAFSNSDKKNLKFQVRPEDGAYYYLTRTDRLDVCDAYTLKKDSKPGFILHIEGIPLKKKYCVIFKLNSGETIPIYINPSNLTNQTNIHKMRKVVRSIKQNGIGTTYSRFVFGLENPRGDGYDFWIENKEKIDINQLKTEIHNFTFKPKISIVVPVYNVEKKWLKCCIDSLNSQVYDNWELCLADDHSTEEYVKQLLLKYKKKDSRIKVVFREENGHISKATNSAIELATGDYIGFMDNDDELAENALFEVVKALNENPQIDFIYTDEDKITTAGKRFDPFFKPNWNATLLSGHNYITHFVVVKNTLLNQTGGLCSKFDGSQDYDFVLRATEKAKFIYHIPKILYHWRTVESSVASDPRKKKYAYKAGQRALENAHKRRHEMAVVEMTENFGLYRTHFGINSKDKVSIILHDCHDLNEIRNTIDSIIKATTQNNFEILVNNDFKEKIANNKVIGFQGSPWKEAVQLASGDYLIFIKSGYQIEKNNWIDEFQNYFYSDSVGIVGGKVITKDNRIENAGVNFDTDAKQIHRCLHGETNRGLGYYFRSVMPQEVFAVTETFFSIKKETYVEVGGIDENQMDDFKGIDLCLRLRKKGLLIVWTPYALAETEQLTILSRKQIIEEQAQYENFFVKWSPEDRVDPYINPYLLEYRGYYEE